MTYDFKYYQNKKQEQVNKFQKAQKKWIELGELYCREYLTLNEVSQEVQAKLKEIEAEEKSSQEKDPIIAKPAEPVKPAKSK